MSTKTSLQEGTFFGQSLIRDRRDQPFIFQILRTLLIQIPFALFLYFTPSVPFWAYITYLPLMVFFLGPHLLMLHNICHRAPWYKKYKTPMTWLTEVIGLFFGLPPRLYYYHHIKMHHKEGNGIKDLSSTERYQRDSFLHWLHYFLRFTLFGFIEVPLYFVRNKRKDYALTSFLGYVFFYSFLAFVTWYNPVGALMIFIVPTAICWFGLMSGNWTQHAFLDADHPEDSFKNSITVIEALYNKRCFNDGYHIGHHLYPGMHWTEMSENFEKEKEKYRESGSIIFKTLDYQTIWFLLMLKRYKTLSKYYVDLSANTLSQDEIVAILKSKLTPIL